ncbi:MAG: GTP-binding protein [Aquificae bacterium]|nr:GTP-binding protein [Aquificota bacterium]
MELKILITGHFSAGKTSFIKTLTGNAVSTEVNLSEGTEKLEKSTTTVAMDYGKIELSGIKLHLFGTPGQDRFDFMLDILGRNIDGAIIIVDSTRRQAIEKTRPFVDFLRKSGKPFIIACNKQDCEGALSPAEIAKLLEIPESITIPLVAMDKKNSTAVIKAIISGIHNNKEVA